MSRGDRVREVRKRAGLTLEKFGEQIGLKRNSLSQIENNVNNLSPALAKAISREFMVSEEWLLTGAGTMDIEMSDMEKLAYWFGKMSRGDEEDAFKLGLIKALSQLNDEGWKVLEKIYRAMEPEIKRD